MTERDYPAASAVAKQSEKRVVGRENRVSLRVDPLEQLGLCLCDLLTTSEVTDVCVPDVRDHADIRSQKPTEKLDFARVVGRDLANQVFVVVVGFQQGERHTDMIVVITRIRVHAVFLLQNHSNVFFRCRFSHASRNGHDADIERVPVSLGELLSSTSLMRSLSRADEPPAEALTRALEMATRRGTILHLAGDKGGATEDVYFLNTESDSQVIAKIQSGELHLPGLKAERQAYIETEEQPDIFTLYEQNIGMLTPIIAEELREAEKIYAEGWIKDAIKEAVSLNKRNWKYIAAILERWSAEGKSDGTYRRDFKKTDPDKYIKGKYGHMVRR